MSPAAFVTVLAAASHPDVTVLRFAFQATSVSTLPILPASWIMLGARLWPLGHADATRHVMYKLQV